MDPHRLILNSHRKIEKWSEQKLRQTRRRTQAGLTPGKDDNEVWHHFCRSRLKVSMGVQYDIFSIEIDGPLRVTEGRRLSWVTVF